MKKNKTLVVIPYLAEAAQGDELLLAVTGWRKHFKQPHRIVIVGDFHPVVEAAKDITFIECPRITGAAEGQYLPHLDIVHKFRRVHEWFPDTEGLIYACDDMYAVRDFTLDHVLAPKLPHEGYDIPDFDWRKERGWMSDLGKTRELCEREGFTQKNWVCHLPIFFSWEKLIEILDRYGCDHESYIVENIYYNKIAILYAMGGVPVLDSECFQHEVKTSNPGFETTDEVGKIWITNANSGWSERLEEIIWKHYTSL